MRKPFGLSIDVNDIENNYALFNQSHQPQQKNYHHEKSKERVTNTISSPSILLAVHNNDTKYKSKKENYATSTNVSTPTTFRDEGLSIGRDYMRMEGHTICPKQSFPSLDDFTIARNLGRGISSIVQLAYTKTTVNANTPVHTTCTPTTMKMEEDVNRNYYALKIFSLTKEVNQSTNIHIYNHCHDNAKNAHYVNGDDENHSNIIIKRQPSMLSQEIKILSNIQCQCIVQFQGAFYNPYEKNITLVLEYMNHGSLHDFLTTTGSRKQRPSSVQSHHDFYHYDILPQPILASIIVQSLYGLAYLHHERIVHRDIKPQNILLNGSGQVKISDLGISSCKKSIHSDDDDNHHSHYGTLSSSHSLNHTVIGTSYYMSPERLFDKSYSYPSDLWSLGLVLLELLTGGWNPMRDGEDMTKFVIKNTHHIYENVNINNDDDENSDLTTKESKSSGTKNGTTTNIIELAMILEDFCIQETMQKLNTFNMHDKINNGKKQINVGWWQQQDLMKANGIGELIVSMLEKEPSKFLSVTILLLLMLLEHCSLIHYLKQ